jgi:hypothetical protein
MPTVTYKCPDTGKNMKVEFAYNATGKAQASALAALMNGTKTDNPNYGMEKKSMGY